MGQKHKARTCFPSRSWPSHLGKSRRSAECPLRVKKGELCGLLRPKGAGKTTTLEMMAGLRKSECVTRMVADVTGGEATRKVTSPLGVQLQSSSFFANLKGVQP